MQRGYHLSNFPKHEGRGRSATDFVTALPDDVRKRLLGEGRPHRFAKGQLIHQRGDPGTEFCYIESGSVQIGRFSADGRLTLFALLGAGDSFGEQAFLGEFPRMVDAIAGSDCTVVRIGEDELQRLINSDAGAARILLKTMAHMVQQAFDMIEDSRNLTVEQRLVQVILRLCGNAAGEILVTVTQQELADLVGVTRVSLGKALARLERAGLVSRKYGKIVVPDKRELRLAG